MAGRSPGGDTRVRVGVAGVSSGCTKTPASRRVSGSIAPRDSTGSGVRFGASRSISTTEIR